MVFASYPASQYPYVPPIEKMQHNGEYTIYVHNAGQWQEAGTLIFDEFFREREIDLGRYISGDEQTRIRIVQKGGEAAHIDSVFLGRRSPVDVAGNEAALRKLARKDFDVIDAYGRSIEVVFRKGIKDTTLRLTARVEDVNKGVPFQFPFKNLCQEINTDADFYAYTLNSQKGALDIDGQLDEVAYRLPFFKEYSLAVTGHPSNYTYGWVWNDDKYLYVAMDFTSDNTWDGDRDFAKVYVKTDDGVKEFKVSVPDTRWGRPGFSYTNKVGFQHKVYEFRIPLSEIDIRDLEKKGVLLLAFSAYGTRGTGGACCIYDDTPPTCIEGVYNAGDCNEVAYPYEYIFLGGVRSCDPNPCPQQGGIPTLSQWGMIVFVILAGIGAGYYMRRQMRKNS